MIETVEGYNQLSFEKGTFSVADCNYGYRTSRFKDEQQEPVFITHVTLRLQKHPVYQLGYGNLEQQFADPATLSLKAVRDAVIQIRREKLPDPAELGNAGSFFINPIVDKATYERLKSAHATMPAYPAADDQMKLAAGWLIEQCGFKGKSHGAVGVYEKQALVLINLGDAQGYEIALVAESIRTAVLERFGVELIPEVKYVD